MLLTWWPIGWLVAYPLVVFYAACQVSLLVPVAATVAIISWLLDELTKEK